MKFKSLVSGLSLEDGREVAYGEVFESDNADWLDSTWVEVVDKKKASKHDDSGPVANVHMAHADTAAASTEVKS